jgi:hypothetical protein
VVRGASAAGFSPPPQPKVKAALRNPAAAAVRVVTLMARSLRFSLMGRQAAPERGAFYPVARVRSIHKLAKRFRPRE